MKRQPPAPKYDLRCCWCGKKLTRNASSWSVNRDASRHDETCPADPIRSSQSPTKESSR